MNLKCERVCLPLLSFVVLSLSAHAQVTVDQLAKPPKEAQRFTILSTSARHGTDAVWIEPDGTRMIRESMLLRGQVFELDEAIKLGSDGMPVKDTVRGFTPNGDAAETFTMLGGTAKWKSQVDAGTATYKTPQFYVPLNSTWEETAVLFEALLAAPDKSLALLPGGRAHAERLTEASVTDGKTTQVVTAWAVTGLNITPLPIWSTAQNKFFALCSDLAFLPEGYEGELGKLSKAQDDAMAARSPLVLKQLLKTPTGPVAFTHVKAFIEGTTFADDQTVVVDHGAIVAEGPSSSV